MARTFTADFGSLVQSRIDRGEIEDEIPTSAPPGSQAFDWWNAAARGYEDISSVSLRNRHIQEIEGSRMINDLGQTTYVNLVHDEISHADTSGMLERMRASIDTSTIQGMEINGHTHAAYTTIRGGYSPGMPTENLRFSHTTRGLDRPSLSSVEEKLGVSADMWDTLDPEDIIGAIHDLLTS